MYENAKAFALRMLRVPPEPADPMGDVDSLIVFRASPNFYKYKLVLWLIQTLISAAVGFGIVCFQLYLAVTAEEAVFGILMLLTIIPTVIFFVWQIPWSYLMMRLDYELRWYKVTDRSLRIREGVTNVREMTMTFDNIQNISVTQGPIQRWLKIADLRVETAGGGGNTQASNGQQLGLNMHVGYFRGIDNADDVLATMQQRLRNARGSGLGDADDEDESPAADSFGEDTTVIASPLDLPGASESAGEAEVVQAARDLLAEVKAMRAAAQG